MMLDVYNLIGGLGVAVFIVAYFATQQGWLAADDWRYPLANLVGAVLVVISLFTAWNLPSFVLETFWIFISLYGLWRSLRRG